MLWEIKILGSVLIIISGITTSVKLLKSNQKNVANAQALNDLISSISEKIEILCIPLPQILKELPQSAFINCGYSFNKLPKNSDELLLECNFKDDKILYDMYSSFLKNLGNGYKKEELAKCHIFLEELNKLLAKRKEDLQKKKKTIPTLCLSVCLGIVVLLL